jgi:thiamine-monophosphate kinase
LTTRGDAPGATVAEAGERALIARIQERLPPPPSSLVVGVGDDAAVAAPDRGSFVVLTTDALVEGIHFDRRFSSAADIGYKALAVNISDVAAMGGAPRFALLSLLLPAQLPVADVDRLLDGLLEMAAEARVTLAGGNISRSPGPLVIDIALTGAVRERKILRRGGARAGDALYVTGTVGAAAAGLGWLRANGVAGAECPSDESMAECVARHRRPAPRSRIGLLLGRTRTASACMDTSDGLADAVRQIAEASGAGATIDASLLPIHPGAARWFGGQGVDAVSAAIGGGDDYELLFAVPAKLRRRLRTVEAQGRGVPMTKIGELTPSPEVILLRAGAREPLPAGFVHF